ncbi:MAG: hypothetical protein HY675_26560 [Chloroflexi bacterium]|nr:hypothetical protein [Chloroflexota bacterium]
MPPARPPALEDVKVQRHLLAPLGDSVSLLGYSLGRSTARPGEAVHLDLYWLANAVSKADLRLRLELLAQDGKVWPLLSSRPLGERYPTTRWRTGDIWRGQYELLLPATLGPGPHRLVVRLEDIVTGREVGSVHLDEVAVLPRERTFVASPKNPLAEEFGRQVRLLGYDVTTGGTEISGNSPAVVAPQRIDVTVYWQAMAEVQTGYTVFVQALDSGGKLVFQHDGVPGLGISPTTGWVAGEVVADTHPLDIPASLPQGDYTIIVGLYDPVSMRRLDLMPGKDFVPLTQLRVSR